MKKRKAWRYTCDFCKKSGCSGGAIANHERRCFRNPNRHCPMCEVNGIAHLLPVFDGINDDNEDEKLKLLDTEADHCPACMLSAMMQGPQQTITWESFDGSTEGSHVTRWFSKFNYKTAADAYMNEKRSEENSYIQLRGDV